MCAGNLISGAGEEQMKWLKKSKRLKKPKEPPKPDHWRAMRRKWRAQANQDAEDWESMR